MSQIKECPRCGGEIVSGDRFCGGCGFDITQQTSAQEPVRPEARTGASISPPAPPEPHSRPHTPDAPASSYGGLGAASSRNGDKGPLIIVVGLLLLLLAAGGGLYWWFSKGEDPPQLADSQPSQPTGEQANSPAPAQPDLTRAATYLPEAGLKCNLFINYPDGYSGNMERVSARVVPAEAVRISVVEMNAGGPSGWGFHYIERADGIYMIYDENPLECSPVLKNQLTVGQSWNYATEFGQIVWTVVDMGVSVDLGFATVDNCLLVKEDNQAVGLQKIIYYAPGMGLIMEKTAQGSTDLLKLTAFSKIDEAQAAEMVKKWCPNYASIQDDRTQG